ncbi:hypothetical protein G9A89_014282 [Geosiphon pyriformis]|nr:hypothetical protein G9A89_014282 [Geosiphon pyriformis]
MVLNYLVVDDKLVIEPNKVKLEIDKIMEGMEELSLVVNNLLNNKTARLSRILNKLWKHCSGEVLACLLKLLNLYLSMSAVFNLWKKA